MDDFKGNELVVGGGAAGDEEEGGITTVDDFCVCSSAMSILVDLGWVTSQTDLCIPESCTCESVSPGPTVSHL